MFFFFFFVGTFGNLLAHLRRQSFHFYRQSIWSAGKEIAVFECENAKIVQTRSVIHRFFQCIKRFVGILSFIALYTISNKRILDCIMYADVTRILRPKKIYVS